MNTFIPNNSLFPTTVVVGQIVAVFRDILEIEIGIVIEKRAKDIGRYGSGVFHCNSYVSTICFVSKFLSCLHFMEDQLLFHY